MIFNRVAAYDLGINSNYRTADAPVSYPFLWGIAYHDKVQWDGSAPNTHVAERLARNVGEVLGVFATLKLEKPTFFRRYYPTSANRTNLIELEERLKILRAPKWPAQYLGQPDAAKVAQGKKLYGLYCAKTCHLPFNPAQPRFTEVFMDPLSQVKTDPTMVINAQTRRVNTGELAGTKVLMLTGPRLKPEDAGASLLLNAVAGAILWPALGPPPSPLDDTVPDDRQTLLDALFVGARPPSQMSPQARELAGNLLFGVSAMAAKSADLKDNGPAYKARPLDGIWATAPYLHNGSVPTLWDLMLPEAQRKPRFYVGSPKFDPVNVGLNTKVQTNFLLDTSKPGNANTGHSARLPASLGSYGIVKPDGTPFSNDKRRAIVEYMKAL